MMFAARSLTGGGGGFWVKPYAVFQSTLTVQGNAFSVGGSTLAVRDGFVFFPPYTTAQLDSSALIPIELGGMVRNTTINKVCYSSGTVAGTNGQYARVSDDTQCR